MAIFKLVPAAFFFISRIRERLPRRCALFAKRAGLLAMTLLFLLMLLLIVNNCHREAKGRGDLTDKSNSKSQIPNTKKD